MNKDYLIRELYAKLLEIPPDDLSGGDLDVMQSLATHPTTREWLGKRVGASLSAGTTEPHAGSTD